MPKVHLPDGRVVNFPYEMTPQQIEAEVTKLVGSAPTSAPQAPGRTWTDTAVEALPMAGGALGGVLGAAGGPLGAMGGAAMGGGGGEAFKQLINRARGADAPGSPMEAAKNIGISGAVQGAIEGVTGLGGRLLTRGASRLYRSALKPSVAIRQEFPNIVQTGLREGVPVSAKGTAKAGRLLTTSAKQADDVIRQAAGGPPVSTRTVVKALRPARDVAQQRAALGLADDTPEIASRARALARQHPGGIPVERAQTLKKTAQDLADTAFRTQERGGTVRTVEPQLNQAVARGLKTGIEERVPAVGAINKRTQDLMGLTKALEAAEGRVGNTLPQAVGARGALSALAGGGTYAATGDPKLGAAVGIGSMLLQNPGSASNIARLMNRTGQATQSQWTPQAIRAALLAMMSSREGP